MREFKVDETHSGYEISRYLREIGDFSSRSLRYLDIFLNNKKVKSRKKLVKKNDILKVYEKKKTTNIQPIEMDLDIIYEDKLLLIINKPPGIIVHPTLKKVEKTLANGIVYYFQSKDLDIIPRFYNRLDMNTSGLLIIAKDRFTQGYLQNKTKVKKYYHAIIEGIIKEDEMVIRKNIAISTDGIKREIRDDGQEAITIVKVIDRNIKFNKTLVEAELLTGRTHQIRVHLSSIGHPIVGDNLYGSKYNLGRHLLHSYKVIFEHPETKKEIEIVCENNFDGGEMYGRNKGN